MTSSDRSSENQTSAAVSFVGIIVAFTRTIQQKKLHITDVAKGVILHRYVIQLGLEHPLYFSLQLLLW